MFFERCKIVFYGIPDCFYIYSTKTKRGHIYFSTLSISKSLRIFFTAFFLTPACRTGRQSSPDLTAPRTSKRRQEREGQEKKIIRRFANCRVLFSSSLENSLLSITSRLSRILKLPRGAPRATCPRQYDFQAVCRAGELTGSPQRVCLRHDRLPF